ncbi:MAG: hypothetical protein HW421_2371 [Ignavibacteria bacterium]|nr:hypothetical protein [Ignavibacteria bacterium]
MKTNLTNEKNKLLDEISKIDDGTILYTIDDIINFNYVKKYSLEPLTQEDIIGRALAGEEAIKNNKTMSLGELEDDIKNWK